MGRIDAQNEMADALVVNVKVNADFAGGTSIQAILYTDDTATVTNGVAILTAPAILTAAALSGVTMLRVDLQGIYPALQQYIGINFVVVGTMSGGGAVDAFLEHTPSVSDINLT